LGPVKQKGKTTGEQDKKDTVRNLTYNGLTRDRGLYNTGNPKKRLINIRGGETSN